MFKAIRIAVLVFILVNVALATTLTKWRTTRWDRTLRVVVYPLNADGSQASAASLAALSTDTFAPIERFMAQEAARHGVVVAEPVSVRLGPVVTGLPPMPPAGNPLAVMLWSLELRWWAWHVDHYAGPRPDIKLFVLFHDPDTHPHLAHSLGLEKGLIGVVNVFAGQEMAGSNLFVMTHEMLHTVGATDKYDPVSNQPLFPDGFADPANAARYPQGQAEVMAGRIPLSATESETPHDLTEVVVGDATAREINWPH